MSLLIKILQAAHCRSTHQFFVMDALPLVSSPRAQRFGSVLLKHYDAYLIGSKDPDKTFRDFRNHVLHVGDNHWGGAPASAEKWYGKLQREMEAGNWPEAAYSAGVLSHYFTDPLMPLHTAQSEKESVIHRPLEWSVTKSYSKIRKRWQDRNGKTRSFVLPHGPDWLSTSITRGATVAHSYYNELIDRYDLAAGSRNPPQGFDDRSIDILATMFDMAITGWAQVLQRAADESRVPIPDMPLSMTTVMATLGMPSAWVTRRIESNEERSAVQAIFDEYQATGRVKDNLPPEVASVRQERQLDALHSGPPIANEPVAKPAAKPIAVSVPNSTDQAIQTADTQDRATEVLPIDSSDQRVVASAPNVGQRNAAQYRPRKPTLCLADDLVDAPSIGPRTAKRFAVIGIHTVAQFLAESPEQMATDLDTRWTTADRIRDWQAQAMLVCEVASLCGYKSQLLVAVGCRTATTLSQQHPDELHNLISDFAKTTDGDRILRGSKVPQADDVRQWISDASDAKSPRKSA
ncbi:DUF4332 domain-containing protein [Planctomycetes bacterium K23_9]|uniref:DUF4332 domain-containing protein n=1 Tax=Stieleria marina TaxID=1930275 RepID=A0A517NZU8_9BACT|nr:hypothetical protein K239x_46520 [Planctomycetes bacterium K23_9]